MAILIRAGSYGFFRFHENDRRKHEFSVIQPHESCAPTVNRTIHAARDGVPVCSSLQIPIYEVADLVGKVS